MNKYDFAYECLGLSHTTEFLEKVYAWRRREISHYDMGFVVGSYYKDAKPNRWSPLSVMSFKHVPEEALEDHLISFSDELFRANREEFKVGWRDGFAGVSEVPGD